MRLLLLIKKTFRIAFGLLLVIIGIIGGLIPILQGWVFGIPGLIILSDYFPPLKKTVYWARNKYKTKISIWLKCLPINLK